MENFEINDKELELIEAIRNLRRCYPIGYRNLLAYAQQVFDELTEPPSFDGD